MREWEELVTGVGIILLLVGAMAADSPGTGHIWAAGMVMAGIAITAAGQILEKKERRKL